MNAKNLQKEFREFRKLLLEAENLLDEMEKELETLNDGCNEVEANLEQIVKDIKMIKGDE
jgi:septal ring factor EnvC (AmiA/AmiB activator)